MHGPPKERARDETAQDERLDAAQTRRGAPRGFSNRGTSHAGHRSEVVVETRADRPRPHPISAEIAARVRRHAEGVDIFIGQVLNIKIQRDPPTIDATCLVNQRRAVSGTSVSYSVARGGRRAIKKNISRD